MPQIVAIEGFNSKRIPLFSAVQSSSSSSTDTIGVSVDCSGSMQKNYEISQEILNELTLDNCSAEEQKQISYELDTGVFRPDGRTALIKSLGGMLKDHPYLSKVIVISDGGDNSNSIETEVSETLHYLQSCGLTAAFEKLWKLSRTDPVGTTPTKSNWAYCIHNGPLAGESDRAIISGMICRYHPLFSKVSFVYLIIDKNSNVSGGKRSVVLEDFEKEVQLADNTLLMCITDKPAANTLRQITAAAVAYKRSHRAKRNTCVVLKYPTGENLPGLEDVMPEVIAAEERHKKRVSSGVKKVVRKAHVSRKRSAPSTPEQAAKKAKLGDELSVKLEAARGEFCDSLTGLSTEEKSLSRSLFAYMFLKSDQTEEAKSCGKFTIQPCKIWGKRDTDFKVSPSFKSMLNKAIGRCKLLSKGRSAAVSAKKAVVYTFDGNYKAAAVKMFVGAGTVFSTECGKVLRESSSCKKPENLLNLV